MDVTLSYEDVLSHNSRRLDQSSIERDVLASCPLRGMCVKPEKPRSVIVLRTGASAVPGKDRIVTYIRF